MSLTKVLNNRILNSIGLNVDGNTYYDVFYYGFITQNMACYDNIVKYHLMQHGNSIILDNILNSTIKTSPSPFYLKVFSENRITFNISLNNVNLCILDELDLNSLFRSEIREYNLEYLFNF